MICFNSISIHFHFEGTLEQISKKALPVIQGKKFKFILNTIINYFDFHKRILKSVIFFCWKRSIILFLLFWAKKLAQVYLYFSKLFADFLKRIELCLLFVFCKVLYVFIPHAFIPYVRVCGISAAERLIGFGDFCKKFYRPN